MQLLRNCLRLWCLLLRLESHLWAIVFPSALNTVLAHDIMWWWQLYTVAVSDKQRHRKWLEAMFLNERLISEECTGTPIVLGRFFHCQRIRLSLCYELTSSAQRNRQTARRKSTQCTNNSDPITSISELLPRQNSVTAHAHQRLTTAQQKSTGQVLPSDLYIYIYICIIWEFVSSMGKANVCNKAILHTHIAALEDTWPLRMPIELATGNYVSVVDGKHKNRYNIV
jgi:hypothetical protein